MTGSPVAALAGFPTSALGPNQASAATVIGTPRTLAAALKITEPLGIVVVALEELEAEQGRSSSHWAAIRVPQSSTSRECHVDRQAAATGS